MDQNLWIKEEIKSNIRKHFELNENENTAYQNLKISITEHLYYLH